LGARMIHVENHWNSLSPFLLGRSDSWRWAQYDVTRNVGNY